MKVMTLILPTILLLALTSRAIPPGIRGAQPLAAITSQDSDARSLTSEATIEPGSRVGPLKLGDSRDRALELFPKKAEDQEWENSCGTTLDWVDAENPTGHGDLFIRLKKGKVFQIDSTTTRFHTAEGITTFDHSEKIASAYKDLRAFTLLTPPSPALGDRPLVFWIDKRRVSPSCSLTIPRSTSAISTRSSSLNPTNFFVRRRKPPALRNGSRFLPTRWNPHRNWRQM